MFSNEFFTSPPAWILIIVYSIFGIRFIKSLSYILFTWQKKEYRYDRMGVYLKSPSGMRWVFNKIGLIGWVIFSLFLAFPHLENRWEMIYFFLLCFSIFTLYEIIKVGFRFPIITGRLIIIFIATIGISGSLFFVKKPIPLTLIWIEKLLPGIVFIVLSITAFPSWAYRKTQIQKAKKKLEKYPDIFRIAIAGSYGKSSTKEFLSTMLAQKFSVSKTPKTINTDIGIAQLILKTISEKTEVALFEMDAYRIGEIKTMANIVKPDIGIITAINEQHVELLGSLEKTRKAHQELAQALEKNGTLILNGDNDQTRLLAKKLKNQKIILYGVSHQYEISASQITATRTGISFILHYGKNSAQCFAPILGKQMIENILAACTVCYELKIPLKTIIESFSHLKTLPGTMTLSGTYNGATVIDDSFSVNPQSLIAAIDYAALFDGNKYIVLQPMIELGKYSEKLHRDVAVYGAKHGVNFIVTNSSYYNELHSAFKEKETVQLFFGMGAFKKILSQISPNDVLIFEGRESKNYLEILQKENHYKSL